MSKKITAQQRAFNVLSPAVKDALEAAEKDGISEPQLDGLDLELFQLYQKKDYTRILETNWKLMAGLDNIFLWNQAKIVFCQSVGGHHPIFKSAPRPGTDAVTTRDIQNLQLR